MAKDKKLTKEDMKEMFRELMLLFQPNQYSNCDKDELAIVLKLYYETLKEYDKGLVRIRMRKYIKKEKFFPKVADLIPQESDYFDYSYEVTNDE